LFESGCKGTAFFNTIQIFSKKNSQKHESFRECLQIYNYTLFIYITQISLRCHFRLQRRRTCHHPPDRG
jgi:hypothetical protein